MGLWRSIALPLARLPVEVPSSIWRRMAVAASDAQKMSIPFMFGGMGKKELRRTDAF